MLATEEAEIKEGYKRAVLRSGDGGMSTVRSRFWDDIRGIEGWPEEYDGRGIVNQSWTDHESGMEVGENKRLYDEKVKEGDEGWERTTGYAGTGVGLISELKPAGEVVEEVRKGMVEALRRATDRVKQLEE
ncbi:2-nitropropane dioxygenase [Myriangium duriaei CBS 260.36]|uniref:2-nitropropane dioxygenase n=1 Tax=Myriangium duriaei CBS 260.36 TaxID=1168546 RepID=A0A9P4J910_9PEZI|nr:2-nitropropane dioxygenase [Myriangium duriaei CBS 260.36]